MTTSAMLFETCAPLKFHQGLFPFALHATHGAEPNGVACSGNRFAQASADAARRCLALHAGKKPLPRESVNMGDGHFNSP